LKTEKDQLKLKLLLSTLKGSKTFQLAKKAREDSLKVLFGNSTLMKGDSEDSGKPKSKRRAKAKAKVKPLPLEALGDTGGAAEDATMLDDILNAVGSAVDILGQKDIPKQKDKILHVISIGIEFALAGSLEVLKISSVIDDARGKPKAEQKEFETFKNYSSVRKYLIKLLAHLHGADAKIFEELPRSDSSAAVCSEEQTAGGDMRIADPEMILEGGEETTALLKYVLSDTGKVGPIQRMHNFLMLNSNLGAPDSVLSKTNQSLSSVLALAIEHRCVQKRQALKPQESLKCPK